MSAANLAANLVQTALLVWLCVSILTELRRARQEAAKFRRERMAIAADQLEETARQLQVEQGSEELLAEVERQVRSIRRLAGDSRAR